MNRRQFCVALGAVFAPIRWAFSKPTARLDRVTLRDAHKGTLEIDTRLLDSYGKLPENIRQFYFDARAVLEESKDAHFSDAEIVAAAKKNNIPLMGGPMLGELRDDGVTIWIRPANDAPLTVFVGDKAFPVKSPFPGNAVRVRIDGLSANTNYEYRVHTNGQDVATGRFQTAPSQEESSQFRVTFGSCFHKIGLHNPNLVQQILKREPHAMMFLGDLAVDDRNNEVNMHRADYQLRDVSQAWRTLASHLSVYASWDDHDYFDNDLSGIPRRFTPKDREIVRQVWHENWNNPPADSERAGIYFNTRVGPVEIIMLDTRSCREGNRRNQYGSYLGKPQLDWLKSTLKSSTAPFKIISSGTMWSDYVSKAKDSWGSWDTKAREEVFSLIEQENIGGVLLVSGDRHGARSFRIPRPSGFNFYEFEPATLGGVSGPAGLVKNCPEQLFGYSGKNASGEDFIAFGEFTFDTTSDDPHVTFRLIDQHGTTKEEHVLTLAQLTPR